MLPRVDDGGSSFRRAGAAPRYGHPVSAASPLARSGGRATCATRNCRRAALRSFFKQLVRNDIAHSVQYTRVLAIPSKGARQRPATYLEADASGTRARAAASSGASGPGCANPADSQRSRQRSAARRRLGNRSSPDLRGPEDAAARATRSERQPGSGALPIDRGRNARIAWRTSVSVPTWCQPKLQTNIELRARSCCLDSRDQPC